MQPQLITLRPSRARRRAWQKRDVWEKAAATVFAALVLVYIAVEWMR